MGTQDQGKFSQKALAPPSDFACALSTRRAFTGGLASTALAAVAAYTGGAFAADEPAPRAAAGAASGTVSGTASGPTSLQPLGTASVSTSATGGNKLEKRSVAIAVVNQAALVYLPLTVAEQMGFFKAEGLDLEVMEAPSLVRAQQMASTPGGGADIVSGWVENTLALQAKGQSFTAFVLQSRAPQIMLGVSTKSMRGFRSLMDLRGKKIGISAPGTPTHTIAYAALSRSGLRLSEMGFVSVGTPSGAQAALRAGQIDALCYTDPLMTLLEQRGDIRVVVDTRTLRGTEQVCGGEMPSTCLYAPPEWLQKHPNTAQAAANAMVRALKWLQTAGVSDLMKIVPESYFAGDRALYLAAFDRMREAIALDGVLPPDGVAHTLRAMRDADPVLRLETIDLAKSFTNVFAQSAKLRFKV
jgi:NitT/TauT family transport system substrate-binding protein